MMSSYTIDELNLFRNCSDGLVLPIRRDDLIRAALEKVLRIHTGDDNEVMLLMLEANEGVAFERLYRFVYCIVANALNLITSVKRVQIVLKDESNNSHVVIFCLAIAKGEELSSKTKKQAAIAA